MLALSIYGFRFLQNSFFPDSTRTQFMVDVWLPGGTRLDQTDRVTAEMRKSIADIPGITHITTSVGQGALRFLLTYSPERFDPSYAQFLIDVKDQSLINEVLPRVQNELTEKYPDAQIISKRFLLGPGEGGRVQVRFSGEDYDTLRSLAAQAMEILRADGGAKGIRIDSREPVPTLRPQFSEAQARLTGITRTDLGRTLEAAFSGQRIGVYREGDELLPIMARGPEAERADPDSIRDVQVFSPVADRFLPVRQIVSDFTTGIGRSDPHAKKPLADDHRACGPDLRPCQHDARPGARENRGDPAAAWLPDGMGRRIRRFLQSESGARRHTSRLFADDGAHGDLPLQFSARHAHHLAHRAAFPHRHRCRAAGLQSTVRVYGPARRTQPFGHAHQKWDRPDGRDQLPTRRRQAPWDAVVDASVSRVRPVSMAVLTTVFGLIPLLFDVFFGAMAVTIVVGLLFASALTLLVVPVLYVTFFKVRPEKEPISRYAEAGAASRA